MVGPLAADTRDVYDGLAGVYLPIAVAVFVVVLALVVLWTVRGRRRTGAPSTKADNDPLEIAFAVGLAVVAAFLVWRTYTAQDDEQAHAAGPPVEVRAIAAKWNWRFEYPRYGISDAGRDPVPALLTVPAGVPVSFHGTSLDVVHGFWLPDMRFQRELFPGKDSSFTLTFPRPGFTSSGLCSFYCGLEHTVMRFSVRVLPRAQFDAWARSGGRG